MPPVAVLPEFRVKFMPPITNVGIDFARPLYYKTKDAKMEKCYIVLYSCCTTRELHLYIVEGLSGTTLIHNFRRFNARRGTLSVITTERANTFK